jgi:hypothetical protein
MIGEKNWDSFWGKFKEFASLNSNEIYFTCKRVYEVVLNYLKASADGMKHMRCYR